jgi:thioredoxin reductase
MRVGVVGGGNSAGQAAVWLADGGALVTLLHRRADLRETMSDYLVRELERYGTVALVEKGFILTGSDAGADHLLETSVQGVFAAGDVRSGSTKRCATAVGDGAMAVQFVHAHFSRATAAPA